MMCQRAEEKKLIFIPLTLFYTSMKSPEICTLLQPIMFGTIHILRCLTNPFIPYDSSWGRCPNLPSVCNLKFYEFYCLPALREF